jgi:tape measure domain-containing protein
MAGTINAASLKIGMDITELKASGQFASNELRSIGRIMTDLEGPTGKFEKQMQLLERAMKQAGLSEEQMAQAQEHLAAKFGVVTPAMQRAAAAADALEKQEKELADQLAFEAQILKQREALMQRGRQLTDSVRSSEEARIAKLKEYNDLLAMGAINEETHSRAIKKLDTDIQQVNSTGAMFNNFIKQNISQLMGMVAGFASVSAAANAFKQSIQLAAEFEASKAAFSVLTGSKSIAGALMVEFRELDKASPLAAAAFERAGKTLLGYGMSVRTLVPTLKQLSEISMGNDERFQSLALAMGQITANGRLMGQEVLQMVNAGFNPLQQISEDTGISMIELRKRMEEGGISAQMVAESLKRATAEGGRFYQMNEMMSKTLMGNLAKLETSFQNLQRTAGTSLGKIAKEEITSWIFGIDIATSAMEKAALMADKMVDASAQIAGPNITAAMITITDFMSHGLFSSLANASQETRNQELLEKQVQTRDVMSKQVDEQLTKQIKLSQQYAQQGEDLAYQLDQLILGNREAERLKSMREGTDFNQAQSVNDQKAQLDFLKEKQRLQDEYEMAANGKKREELDYERNIRNGMTEEQAGILLNAAMTVRSYQEADRQVEERFRTYREEAKRAAEESQRAFKDSQREADRLFNQFNPQDRMRGEFEKLLQLRQGGFIDDTLMNQAGVSLAAGFVQNASGGLASTIAPALRAGSVEAYKFIAQQNEKSKQAAEAKKLAEDQLKELRKIAEQNTNAPRLAMAGRN